MGQECGSRADADAMSVMGVGGWVALSTVWAGPPTVLTDGLKDVRLMQMRMLDSYGTDGTGGDLFKRRRNS